MRLPRRPSNENARQHALEGGGLRPEKPRTGLGQAITRELLQQMGRSVHYQSRNGGEAKLAITLPIAESTS